MMSAKVSPSPGELALLLEELGICRCGEFLSVCRFDVVVLLWLGGDITEAEPRTVPR